MGHGLGTLHQRISLGKTIKVLDFAHFVICLRDPWVSLQPKFQSQIFYGYQDIAVWKVDKIQTQILQTKILNGHNFWLADRNDLKVSIHMNINKRLQKMPQYSILKTHSDSYWFNGVAKPLLF